MNYAHTQKNPSNNVHQNRLCSFLQLIYTEKVTFGGFTIDVLSLQGLPNTVNILCSNLLEKEKERKYAQEKV